MTIVKFGANVKIENQFVNVILIILTYSILCVTVHYSSSARQSLGTGTGISGMSQ